MKTEGNKTAITFYVTEKKGDDNNIAAIAFCVATKKKATITMLLPSPSSLRCNKTKRRRR
jgi:hypothetical protein